MVLKKKTKKVLLGFVTTTSFILLVMVATTTASLQQQDNDNETETSALVNATTDEPNILIGPAEEGSPKVIQLQYLSSFFFTFQV
jgi:hypothetical protein